MTQTPLACQCGQTRCLRAPSFDVFCAARQDDHIVLIWRVLEHRGFDGLYPMNRHSIRPTRYVTAAFSCFIGLFAAGASLASATPAEPALMMLQRVEGSAVPAIARLGTGAYGVFNGKMLDAAEVTIALPDGRILQATRQQMTEDKTKGRKSWVGTFAEEPGSIVAFSTVHGVTSGFISYGAETWEVLPARAGKHVLYRVDDRKLPTAELEESQAKLIDQDLAATTSDFGLGATTAASGEA